MLVYDADAYTVMMGNISEDMVNASAKCVSQCTGCTCSCRCSCSGGIISDLEWEEA